MWWETPVVVALVLASLFYVVRSMVPSAKKPSGCGGCSGCPPQREKLTQVTDLR